MYRSVGAFGFRLVWLIAWASSTAIGRKTTILLLEVNGAHEGGRRINDCIRERDITPSNGNVFNGVFYFVALLL